MKEINEGNITYIVSDNYPASPYVKVVKTVPTATGPVITLQSLDAKLDQAIADIATIKTQTKPKV
jgi:hypothetical protein